MVNRQGARPAGFVWAVDKRDARGDPVRLDDVPLRLGHQAGQERVLAIRMTRSGFEQALSEACLSHFDPDLYESHDEWLARKEAGPVRVQWDPERSIHLEPLPWRSLQIGLSGSAVYRYVSEWITAIDDVTADVRNIRRLIDDHHLDDANDALPAESAYPMPRRVADIIGM